MYNQKNIFRSREAKFSIFGSIEFYVPERRLATGLTHGALSNDRANSFSPSTLYSFNLLTCAREETRTPKALRPLPPQGSASTNFATRASGLSPIQK